MNDVVLIVTVLVVAIGGLAGVAYLLDKRRKTRGAIGPQLELPPLGPVGRGLLWVIRGLVVMMVLAIVVGIAFRVTALIWLAAGCLLVYLLVGWILRVVRLSGK